MTITSISSYASEVLQKVPKYALPVAVTTDPERLVAHRVVWKQGDDPTNNPLLLAHRFLPILSAYALAGMDCVITSFIRSTNENSLHYFGQAIDVRLPNPDRIFIASKYLNSLTDPDANYTECVPYTIWLANDHLHIFGRTRGLPPGLHVHPGQQSALTHKIVSSARNLIMQNDERTAMIRYFLNQMIIAQRTS